MHNDPLDRAIIATSRLAQGGSAPASAALREIRERWEDAIRPHTKDQASLDLVMLVSDGLYFNNALDGGAIPGPVPRGDDLEALIALVRGESEPRAERAHAQSTPTRGAGSCVTDSVISICRNRSAWTASRTDLVEELLGHRRVDRQHRERLAARSRGARSACRRC